jgi:hypothetical protein
MLSRLVLLLVQLVVAWFAAPPIVAYVPPLGGNTRLFVFAVVAAILVWVVGLVGAQVLRDTGTPSSSTLVAALVLALVGAAIYTWLPVVAPDARGLLRNLNELAYPLIGALLGYHIKR